MLVPAAPDTSQLLAGVDPEERHRLTVGYLNRPDPAVRLAAIRQGVDEGIATVAVVEELVDQLADPDPAVRTAAAELNWTLHRDASCKRAVMILRDEIRGHTMTPGTPSTESLRLGKDRAVAALDTLLTAAPDDVAGAGLQALIDEHVVIADRVGADPDLVLEFVEKVERRRNGVVSTYEVYRAADRRQAITYLKAHPVTEHCY